MGRSSILLLDLAVADSDARTVIVRSLSDRFEITEAAVADTPDPVSVVSDLCAVKHPDGIVMALRVSSCEFVRMLFRGCARELASVPVIVVVATSQPDEVSELLRAGVADFMQPPLGAAEIVARITRLIAGSQRSDPVVANLKAKWGLQNFVGESPAFVWQIEKIPMLARCGANVLISGETGTGKELVARAIHYLSYRSAKPFLALNCGAVPPELAESELFGHERGAFTSAYAARNGLIQDAEGGTVFLDEVNCLPLSVQSKFLRLLQEREYRPIGSTRTLKSDVRIVAASNVNLTEAVAKREFRQDLFYRLNVLDIVLPPLRERIEDIPLLARHFLRKYSSEFEKPGISLAPDTLQALVAHDWPGNIRELENVIQGAVACSRSAVIHRQDLRIPGAETSAISRGYKEVKAEVIDRFESTYICQMLMAHRGNISAAAASAKKDRRAFFELMRKHKIDARRFRVSGM